MLIPNTDARSKDYANLLDTFRPGHADYAYWRKYGLRDPRGGGRASARLTAPMVAAGAVAKKWLAAQHGIGFQAWMAQLGEVEVPFSDAGQIGRNPFFAPDAAIVPRLEQYMDELRKAPTRALTGFEERSLASLRNGEDLVTDATVNRIHLLGAVRAARQCLDCHNVERGALLGAFSYELRRTPPLVVEKAS